MRLALVTCLGLSGCAGAAVVAAGHRAVLMEPDGALAVLDEGVTDVPPDGRVDDFDLRVR